MDSHPADPLDSGNHVFVDFENVHHVELSVIAEESVSFTLLLGARQKKLDAELVEMLLSHASSVHLIRLASSGKNALDFALAYYVGRAATSDPAGRFHIVSKDQGFDPLVEHLRANHVDAIRHNDFSTLTFLHPRTTTRVAGGKGDLPGRVLQHLHKNTKNRPKRLKTLESHLMAFSGTHRTREDVLALIESLKAAGHISIDENGRVTYAL